MNLPQLLVMLYLIVTVISNSSNLQFVNPLIGTDNSLTKGSGASYAGMIPSTAPPFAMTRWTPMTQLNNVSKCTSLYSQEVIYGFLGTYAYCTVHAFIHHVHHVQHIHHVFLCHIYHIYHRDSPTRHLDGGECAGEC
jgi:hypothetical protein